MLPTHRRCIGKTSRPLKESSGDSEAMLSSIQMLRTSTELKWPQRIGVPRPPLNQPAWPATWLAEGGPISRWVPSKGQPVKALESLYYRWDVAQEARSTWQRADSVDGRRCWRLWPISWQELGPLGLQAQGATCAADHMRIYFLWRVVDMTSLAFRRWGCTFDIYVT